MSTDNEPADLQSAEFSEVEALLDDIARASEEHRGPRSFWDFS